MCGSVCRGVLRACIDVAWSCAVGRGVLSYEPARNGWARVGGGQDQASKGQEGRGGVRRAGPDRDPARSGGVRHGQFPGHLHGSSTPLCSPGWTHTLVAIVGTGSGARVGKDGNGGHVGAGGHVGIGGRVGHGMTDGIGNGVTDTLGVGVSAGTNVGTGGTPVGPGVTETSGGTYPLAVGMGRRFTGESREAANVTATSAATAALPARVALRSRRDA